MARNAIDDEVECTIHKIGILRRPNVDGFLELSTDYRRADVIGPVVKVTALTLRHAAGVFVMVVAVVAPGISRRLCMVGAVICDVFGSRCWRERSSTLLGGSRFFFGLGVGIALISLMEPCLFARFRRQVFALLVN